MYVSLQLQPITLFSFLVVFQLCVNAICLYLCSTYLYHSVRHLKLFLCDIVIKFVAFIHLFIYTFGHFWYPLQ